MKMSFVLNCGVYLKAESGFVSIQIQDMFKNGKPYIVLKTLKGFNIKKLFL